MVTIPDSDINPLTVGCRTPLDAAERTAGPDRRAPNDVAVIWIECPIDAALLAKANNITYEIGACPSKIKVLAGGNRTIRVCPGREKAREVPGVKALQSLRPLDLSGLQIQRKGGVEEIISRGAIRGRSRVLASFHVCGCGVVVSGTDEERTALWINRGWLPNRTPAVSSRLSAIVRHVEGLPTDCTVLLIKRYDTAAKRATRICRISRQGFFARRNPDVNNAVENNGRSSNDCCRMIVHLCHPSECSCFPIYGHHVRAVVHLLAIQNVSNDYLVPIYGRANTGDSSIDAVVGGNLVRPDQPTAVLLDCEEIATPIREVNRVTVHRRSSRNIATRCEHPFRGKTVNVGRADGVLCRLVPTVA